MRFVGLVGAVMLVGCGRVGFDAVPALVDDAHAPDDVAGSFCEQVVADLCTDFDDGATTNWVEGGITNGNYVVDMGALLSTCDPLATTTDICEGYINHVFGVGSRITLAIDVRLDEVGQGDGVIAQVRFSGTQRHGIEYVYRSGSGSYVEEFRDNVFDPYPIAGPSLSLGQVHRIEMDMDLRATPHMIVRQDGNTVLDTNLIGNVTGTARASVGLVYLRGPSTNWTIRTDNVVVDIE